MISILIVDDDKEATAELSELLSTLLSADVCLAHSICTAQAALLERRFDALLIDFLLPDGTALDLVFTASQSTAAKFLWSGDVVAAEQRFRERSDWQFLGKPLDVEALVTMLRAIPAAK